MNFAQRGFASTALIFALLALLFIGAGIYYLFFNAGIDSNSEIKRTEVQDSNEKNVIGKNKVQLKASFGEPVAQLKSNDGKKEIWVYKIEGDDSTGIFFYLKDGVVVSTKNDEFNGEIVADDFFNQISTDNWKEYDGGTFTIKIPPKWNKSDSLSSNSLGRETTVFTPYTQSEIDKQMTKDPYNPSFYLEVEVRENPQAVSLEEWTKNAKYTAQSIYMQRSKVKIAGQDAVKVTGTSSLGEVDYYLLYKQRVINIGYYFSKDDPEWISPDGFTREIFEAIVQSVKLKD